jgi:hypothetical protein
VLVHVEGQEPSVGLEDAGEEVEWCTERFAGVEAGAGVVVGGLIQDIEQDLFVWASGQPSVGSGILLPEGAPVVGLPAFDGLRGVFGAAVGGQLVLAGPAAHVSVAGLEVQAAVEFAGGSAGGGRRPGGEVFGEQGVTSADQSGW